MPATSFFARNQRFATDTDTPLTTFVTPTLQEGAELKVWDIASGQGGLLPSQFGLKLSPSTTTEDVYAALEAFAAAECKKTADRWMAQCQKKYVTAKNETQLTPTLKALSFQGDDIPRSPVDAVGQFFKQGADFQAKRIINAWATQMNRDACCALM
ncbi:unnamed protein product [Prorocentrum cordatum]|uniref:Uncharacterized protein n=1 Tax=Prorocentrum cordatum TaxID=2364126 RepID=A0ABN9RU28_9DINO|nr:unnamed protein product [Polarella glacialis]